MKPAMFDYVRADSAEQAASLLQRHGEGARILAGGQSLMAVLNMRLAQPALLIDISRTDDLDFVRSEGGMLAVGAAALRVIGPQCHRSHDGQAGVGGLLMCAP